MRWLAAGVFTLSACNAQQPKAADPPSPSPPHYQAVGTTYGIYVLDTVTGNVSKCMTALSDETWCTTPVPVREGKGPPAWIKGASRQP